ncbi:cell division protein SepF [Sporanaerobacter acetigenes]|uniref:Cell division protein SepF n=1 Tax=Sporanaerobacter acetigenes DSM 13106 TaxID=1123281 RepID=A0A1M5XVS2_9FIRM|nr:cell division protein SepF [Sporanaerobacter acetigenes]SHI03890.1 cell division inhibitor SepF [Sporanaerobacter acetigenes DSM 13106]
MSNFMNKFKYFMGLEDLEDEYEEYEDYDEEELDIPQPVKVNNKVVSIHNNMNMKLVVHEPLNYEDAPKIIDDLKMRKTVVVNLEELELECKKQIFDFINGGLYALEGNIHKVTKDIFILAPNNVEIDGQLKEDIKSRGLFTW